MNAALLLACLVVYVLGGLHVVAALALLALLVGLALEAITQMAAA